MIKSITSIVLALTMSMPMMFKGCGGNGDTQTDGSSQSGTYYYVYTFDCEGDQLDDSHYNTATFSYASGQGKRVSVSDFYMYYTDGWSFQVSGSGSWSGTMGTGNTISVTGLSAWIGGSRVNASGSLYIQSMDLVRDGNYNGRASYSFST